MATRRDPLHPSSRTTVRSDSLPTILRLIEEVPELRSLIEQRLLRVQLVVDASIINAELRWRLKRRKNPDARSALMEAQDAGVVALVAPRFLVVEIEKHLAEIAERTATSLEAARAEWRAICEKLRFFSPPLKARAGIADPNDVAYVDASEALGIPIYTRDSHFDTVGVSAVLDRIDLHFRDHARGMAVTLTFTVGSAIALQATFALLRQAVFVVRRLLAAVSSLPDAAKCILIGAALVAIIHPTSRAKLKTFWLELRASAGSLMAVFGNMAFESISVFAEAETRSSAAQREIALAMPVNNVKRSALVLARRACCVSDRPLSLRELVRLLELYGYVSRAKNFPAYLRRTLRNSGEFLEVNDGMWALRLPVGTAVTVGTP